MADARTDYHEKLSVLKADTARLAALVGEQVVMATQALLDGDLVCAGRVISGDRPIDDLYHGIEEQTYVVMARQGPMASELRTLVAVLRVIHEIERCGDLMVDVAKATRRLHPHGLVPSASGLIAKMGVQAGDQLRTAIEAFQHEDKVLAAAVEDMDEVMDDLTKVLFWDIFFQGAPDETALQRAVQVALVGRYYERIADHAVNISHRVRFVATGELSDAGQEAKNVP